MQLLRLPDGTVKVLGRGQARARIKRFVPTERLFLVEVDETVEDAKGPGVEVEALDALGAVDVRDLRQAQQARRRPR
jgi:ATP-dependent Lon protease